VFYPPCSCQQLLPARTRESRVLRARGADPNADSAAVVAVSDERNQTVDRQRHDRIERHAQSVRAPSGADFHV